MATNFSIDPKQFRSALGSFATGVTVITTVDAEGHDIGVTARKHLTVELGVTTYE
ncbi:3-hydroxy-9,10-secoandrosta-1,3,5(10)-triene-9,17-dione monooxygenase reductase component [Collimonas sp. OK607]|nr:3-hydroxy-9,10-secoandrosta-1,3,5(10)-triene-9,17-dione monooxygenase reductase component [Collimonas sp. OK607]